ncbi:hypothetical protein LRH25_21390 [Ideonella azotifigens]|uniref:Uncharacterized protein n=1 Tax=Ideonella azotifigens TaxID=513160 RepID=A0ABP3VGY0_9BURK|nr:hypothetical protein [Ideonella azotifigens]MCD2342888.1 hypothetical protein [Ideonella azotifigens]
MGSIVYSFLNDSLLFDPGLIREQFKSLSEAALAVELLRYREYCLQHRDTLVEEAAPEDGKLRVYVGADVDRRFLKQAAFYLDTVVCADPLFALTHPKHESTAAFTAAFEMPDPSSLDRRSIAEAAQQMLEARPLVAAGYVLFLPTSLEEEAPSSLPIYAPDDGFEGILPRHILDLYKAAATVRSMRPSSRGLLILNHLEVGRRIHIDFEPGRSGGSFVYNLVEQEVLQVDRKAGTVQVAMRMPADPPTKESFDAWVAQSINSSARNHFDALARTVRWSSQVGAQCLVRSGISASVLEATGDVSGSSIDSSTATGVLNLNVPFFDGVSMANLMAARADEEVFRRFRKQLEKHFRELRLELDPEKRRLKTENAMHELVDIQLTEVDSTIRRLKRKAVLSGIGGLASFAAAIPTSGTSLLGSLCAGYAGFRTYEEYRVSTKENPAYFLWRANGNAPFR